MKKTLVAIAALTAVSAFAQSSVTAYGVLDAGYSASEKTIAGTKFGQNAVSFNNVSTSRIGFKGTEDLGAGMSANFVVESGVSSNATTGTNAFLPGVANTPGTALTASGALPVFTGAPTSTTGTTIDATSLGNRELNASVKFASGTMVGVGYGSTAIRSTVLGYAADGGINAVGNILVNDTQFSSNRATGISVAQPLMAGLVGSVAFSQNNTTKDGVADNKTGTGYAASLKYDNGPLSAAVAYQDSATVTSTTATPTIDKHVKTTIVGASYDLTAAKLFAQFGSVQTGDVGSLGNNVQGEGKRSAYSIGARFPMGAFTPFVQYSSGNKNESYYNAQTAEKRDYKGQTIGVNYDLSKRTYAYGVMGSTKLNAGSAVAQGVEIKNTQTTFGIVHSF